MSDLLTAQEAADLIGLNCKKTFANWRSSNYLGARKIKKVGRKFSRRSVEEFKESLL